MKATGGKSKLKGESSWRRSRFSVSTNSQKSLTFSNNCSMCMRRNSPIVVRLSVETFVTVSTCTVTVFVDLIGVLCVVSGATVGYSRLQVYILKATGGKSKLKGESSWRRSRFSVSTNSQKSLTFSNNCSMCMRRNSPIVVRLSVETFVTVSTCTVTVFVDLIGVLCVVSGATVGYNRLQVYIL